MKMLASLYVDGIMTEAQRETIIDELLSLQKPDGGWNLATLGRNWKRADGTPQDYDTSDGYGTGFVIYAVRTAGVPADDPRIRKGVRWLKANQRASGRWFTRSMDKDSRNLITHSGTAYAILALAACGETAPPPPTPPQPYEGTPVTSERPPAPRAMYAQPFSADKPLRQELSLKAEAKYLDASARAWQREKNCFACHTDYVYLIARPAMPRGLATHNTIRAALEQRVDNPRVKRPSPYQNSEAVTLAAVLALNDAATTGKLHPLTRKALDRMWPLQRKGGGWTWQKGNKPPSGIDDYFGVAMAAIGAGAAPGDYRKTPAAREGITRLREYFRPPPHKHTQSCNAAVGFELHRPTSDRVRTARDYRGTPHLAEG